MTQRDKGSDDPRYVAVVEHRIEPSNAEGARRWVRENTVLEPGTKVQIIFTPRQVRFYPLNRDRDLAGTRRAAPLRFRVSPFQFVRSSDHVILSDQGIAVYTPVASREERMRWAIARARPDSLLDQMEVITELQHLIAHKVIVGEIQTNYDFDRAFSDFQSLTREALWLNNTDDRLTQAKQAITAGSKLVLTTHEGTTI